MSRTLAVAATAAILSTAFAAAPRVAGAQSRRLAEPRVTDSAHIDVLKTRDGSTLVGRVVGVAGDTVRFASAGAVVTLSRGTIQELREVPASSVRDGTYWPADPNPTRLLFGPTGRTLARGEGYFSSHDLLLLGTAVGLTDRVTMGGGMTVIPSGDLSNNIFYLTPKVGVVSGERVNVAVGGFIGSAGGLADEGDSKSFGIVYGAATLGVPSSSVTFGTGFGYHGAKLSRSPALMAGANLRMSRRTAFITENYLLPGESKDALVSYGVRILGDKLAVDLAFLNVAGEGGVVFPGVPFVSFVAKF